MPELSNGFPLSEPVSPSQKPSPPSFWPRPKQRKQTSKPFSMPPSSSPKQKKQPPKPPRHRPHNLKIVGSCISVFTLKTNSLHTYITSFSLPFPEIYSKICSELCQKRSCRIWQLLFYGCLVFYLFTPCVRDDDRRRQWHKFHTISRFMNTTSIPANAVDRTNFSIRCARIQICQQQQNGHYRQHIACYFDFTSHRATFF